MCPASTNNGKSQEDRQAGDLSVVSPTALCVQCYKWIEPEQNKFLGNPAAFMLGFWVVCLEVVSA